MFSLYSKHEIVKTDMDLPVRFFYSREEKRSQIIPHFHDDIEIIYVISGRLSITRNTVETTLYAGDIVVFNPNIIHSTLSGNTLTTAYILQISYDFLKSCQKDHDNNAIFFDIPLASKETTSPEQEQALSALKRHLDNLQPLYLHPEDYSILKLYSTIYEITHLLFRHFLSNQAFKVSSSQYKYFERLSLITTYQLRGSGNIRR